MTQATSSKQGPPCVRRLRKIDILDQPAEALIYSTNVFLSCSGGVGGALVDRYGAGVQEMLQEMLPGSARRGRAAQGSIFEGTLPNMPYRQIFHTVPADIWQNTTPEVVERVLAAALGRCVELGLRSVALSALATGFGHMMLDDFLLLADRVLAAPAFQAIPEVTLCINDPPGYALALRLLESRNLKLQF